MLIFFGKLIFPKESMEAVEKTSYLKNQGFDCMSENSTTWYYANNGKPVGPFDAETFKDMVANGEVKEDTSVWNGQGDWKKAKDTNVFENHKSDNLTAPPPLKSQDIDNKFVWWVVAVPIIGSILELMFSGVFGAAAFLIYLIPNIALCAIDERKLKEAGHEAPSTFWVILVPVYLWKRAKLLSQSKIFFFAWIVSFLISIFITDWANEDILAQSACPVVTDIIKEQFYGQAECKAVTIDEKVSDNFYRATATLDNGNDLRITIEDRDDSIYVVIPNDQ